MIAKAATDFASNGVVVLARELAISGGGRVAMKDLVAAVMERDVVSEATARRSIRKAVPEGREEGVSLWMERADNNPNGELVIFVE